MTEFREAVQTRASANDDRVPKIYIERITVARLIEALCDKVVSSNQESAPTVHPPSSGV